MNPILMTEQQQKTVSDRVKAVEAKVNAEIVPMLVARSSAIGHVRVLIFLMFLILILLIDASSFFWLSPKVEIMIFVFGILIALGLSKCLLRYPGVQRWLTSDADEESQVRARAELEFLREASNHTEKQNTIFLYCSAMERRAFVFSSPEIQKQISEEFRAQIKGALVSEMRRDRPDLAFLQALDLIEAALRDKAPAPKNKANEVDNQVRIKD